MRPALSAVFLLAACSRGVAPGSAVTLEYELSSDGFVIESSAGREPLVVTQGAGNLLVPVDEALLGLKAGDEKVVELTPVRAFGMPDPDKIKAVPLARFGALGASLKPGGTASGMMGGAPAEGRVLSIEKGVVTLDFNHPLAGKALRYKLKVLSIRAR